MTFEEMAIIEPELAAMRRQARESRDPCSNRVYYGYVCREDGIRHRITCLAGRHARDDRLRTPRSYEVAADTIYGELPPCRHDGMCCAVLDEERRADNR